ncbi:MAG TPA: TOPRIM nucleotidyl transferase/hydrolase domain-containing protein [Gaiellaceae bacterium]|nr:TOPRIM nucleotidyl transferase/hydrolase domain-containing protein [Gaiellaceae bacterium]
MALIRRVTIQGFRGARDVTLHPGPLCALVGESSSGKSTVLSAVWALLEAAAPTPTGADVSRGHVRVRVEAAVGERTLFLDARPPTSLNLNREGAPPALYFPAALRPTTQLAATDARAHRWASVVDGSRTPDGGLTLVRSIAALAEARMRGVVVLIEEPELFLGPPAQRHLQRLLRALAARGRNQILYSTHSPVFLGVDRLDELVLVRHDARTGTVLVQPEPLDHRHAFRLLSEFDSERAEIFLSRAVLLVEGRTEKLAFPFVFRALGYDVDAEAITVVDCAGKGNIALFAEICNACGVPYVVVHDRDAPRGQEPSEAERIANETLLRIAGPKRTVTLVPDFEAVAGLRARRGKPLAAWRRFRAGGDVPGPLRQAAERVVAAARRAPRTTRGA